MTIDIRNTDEIKAIVAKGYRYATTDAYSGNKYKVRSKHRTLAAAEKSAKGTNRTIEFLDQ